MIAEALRVAFILSQVKRIWFTHKVEKLIGVPREDSLTSELFSQVNANKFWFSVVSQ